MPIYINGKEFEVEPLKPPEIYIPKNLWDDLLNEVDKFRKDGVVRAYGLITKRRNRGDRPLGRLGRRYTVIRIEKIELEFDPDDKLNYKYVRQKEAGAYKTKEAGERYSGAVEIRDELSYTPADAYWIGREKIDFNIYINSAKKYKAYWVDHYWGKHYETTVELSQISVFP